jgi:hypothetical protein
MKNHHQRWTVPVTGALLFATAVSAEQDLQTYLDSTNRITLSLRFGLNISGKFKGIGGSLNPSSPGNGRRTLRGDKYNYDNGYVLTDISGNAGGQTWYWGYDSSSQVNSGANSIAFDRNTTLGLPGENSNNDSPYVGAELTYDYEIGIKENWHHLRYGLEAAINFMPISFNSGGLYNATLSRLTDTYSYTPGTTPPSAPYDGSYQGPGFVINAPPISSVTTLVPGATFLAQQHFDANLWGGRLGPYIEFPLTEKLSLHLSGGLAVGLLDGQANWRETLTLPGGGTSTTTTGGGNDTSLLWGYYVGLDASYQINDRWGVEVGVQFQDLGTYDHDFGGRQLELDLSRSLFIQAGISYSF